MKSASSSEPLSGPRQVVCATCGESFGCDLSGQCWCTQEEFSLPLPVAGADCLCPRCLRAMATARRQNAISGS